MRAVFVLFDSLNRSTLGFCGGTSVPTPNFDRFAARSARFEQHYVGSLPCMPARRDMQTGRLTFMHRSWGPLEPFDNSLPRHLSSGGIYTHIISDHWHYFEDGGCGYTNAFDTWDFIRGQEGDPWKAVVQPPLERFREAYDDRHYGFSKLGCGERNVTRGTSPNKGWKKLRHAVNRDTMPDEADFPVAKCFAAGNDFLRSNHGADDWLLHLEAFDPHEPFHAPARFKEAFQTGFNGKVLDWPVYETVTNSEEEIAEIRANYAALVAMCDHYFGTLLDTLDELEMWDDTCVILTTDHGFLLSEHDWWGKNRMPYYEEISHIPLAIWHPDMDGAGAQRKSLTQTTDLMPTILDLWGLPVPEEVTGTSLLPMIEHDAPNRDAQILGMFGGPICAVDGRYAYYHYPVDLSGDGLNEYTLMPSHMAGPFALNEFEGMELAAPFDFTKGVNVLKITARSDAARPPGQDGVGLDFKGNELYDLKTDPGQLSPLDAPEIRHRMETIIVRELRRHDAPPEIFTAYALPHSQSRAARQLA